MMMLQTSALTTQSCPKYARALECTENLSNPAKGQILLPAPRSGDFTADHTMYPLEGSSPSAAWPPRPILSRLKPIM